MSYGNRQTGICTLDDQGGSHTCPPLSRPLLPEAALGASSYSTTQRAASFLGAVTSLAYPPVGSSGWALEGGIQMPYLPSAGTGLGQGRTTGCLKDARTKWDLRQPGASTPAPKGPQGGALLLRTEMHFWKVVLFLCIRLPSHPLHVSLLMGTTFTFGHEETWPGEGMTGKTLTRCFSFHLFPAPCTSQGTS